MINFIWVPIVGAFLIGIIVGIILDVLVIRK